MNERNKDVENKDNPAWKKPWDGDRKVPVCESDEEPEWNTSS